MKTRSLLLSMLLLMSAPMPAAAQHDHEARATTSVATPDHAALTDGGVKKVDKASGKVTIAHGPMPSGMSAMTMAFRVMDPAWLDRFVEGQKIRFYAQAVDGALTITYFEPAK